MCLCRSLTHSHSLTSNGWLAMGCSQWYTAQVLALPPFSIHDFTLFLVRLHFGAAALHRRLFLDRLPAAVSSLCSSPDQLRLRKPHFFPTYSGGKRLCLFMVKNGFVTVSTSAFSTLLLQGLVFGSILTTQKNPLTVKVGISAMLLILH